MVIYPKNVRKSSVLSKFHEHLLTKNVQKSSVLSEIHEHLLPKMFENHRFWANFMNIYSQKCSKIVGFEQKSWTFTHKNCPKIVNFEQISWAFTLWKSSEIRWFWRNARKREHENHEDANAFECALCEVRRAERNAGKDLGEKDTNVFKLRHCARKAKVLRGGHWKKREMWLLDKLIKCNHAPIFWF